MACEHRILQGRELLMKREHVTRLTSVLLLIVTSVCIVTGLIKWPGLLSSLGMSYRQIPLGVVTDLHIWSGLCMFVLCLVHVFQVRSRLKSMIWSSNTRE
jgi:hypothetical protein